MTEAELTPHQKHLAERMKAEGFGPAGHHRTRTADIAAAPPPQINFVKVARISQDLKGVMHHSFSWGGLRADQRESLDMIQYCVARILSGEADMADTWDVLAVHATGVSKRLSGK